MVGCCIAPINTTTIYQVSNEINKCKNRSKMLVEYSMKLDLDELEGNDRDEIISVELSTLVLENMLEHFMPRQTIQ